MSKKENDKYIVIVPNPMAHGNLYDWNVALRKVEFPIDKQEEKVLDDIRKYLRGNSHMHYRVFRGREVYL